jgi:hypothetical protein
MKSNRRTESEPTIVAPGFILLAAVTIIGQLPSNAGARDLSSHTANPRQSHTGVKTQQGTSQLDADAKRDLGGIPQPPKRNGGIDMQQGRILRDKDRNDGDRGANNRAIVCRTNCRK